MPEFKIKDKVVLEGTVVKVCEVSALVETTNSGRLWIRNSQLEHDVQPAPVMVRCELGIEHPLTDLPTLRDRCKALGMKKWGNASLYHFEDLCAELAEKGVTAEQFVEGVADASKKE